MWNSNINGGRKWVGNMKSNNCSQSQCSLFSYIGFTYNDDTQACGLFKRHDTASLGHEASTRIYMVDSPLACLQDSHCSSPSHLCHKMTCSECPQGWTSNPATGRCYRHVEERRSWAGARAWCRDNGGDLASAPDQDTRTFLSTLTDDQAWIGENNNV